MREPELQRGAGRQGCSQAGCSPELERRPGGRGLSVGVGPSGLRDAPDILLPAATIHVFAPTALLASRQRHRGPSPAPLLCHREAPCWDPECEVWWPAALRPLSDRGFPVRVEADEQWAGLQ